MLTFRVLDSFTVDNFYTKHQINQQHYSKNKKSKIKTKFKIITKNRRFSVIEELLEYLALFMGNEAM
ncbi:MAG: hypothetical protein LBB45_00525 [Methanobrevibacter sp.]|nr:hypothetical protein [Candidatus Methanovirga basalitermitum]